MGCDLLIDCVGQRSHFQMLRENMCTHTHNINTKRVKQCYIKKNKHPNLPKAEHPQTNEALAKPKLLLKKNKIHLKQTELRPTQRHCHWKPGLM